ncbi:archaeosortase/exosortase family protein [Pseudanabaena biceps]|nr:archaeosortase/exosortase family protein [Pseudanabaena biceps]
MEAQIQIIKNQFIAIAKYKYLWVLVALGFLAILHINYSWKISGKTPTLLTFLGWASIGLLLWRKQEKLKFRGRLITSITGILLVLWMVIRHTLSQSNLSLDVLSFFFPLITITGLLMVVKGFNKLSLFKSELAIATLISLPFASLYALIKPIINIDAQLLSFMLHYIGFKVSRQGDVVMLPNGSVEVMATCSSVSPILTMLPFIVLLLSIYQTSRSKQIFVYISTVLSVFFLLIILDCVYLQY